MIAASTSAISSPRDELAREYDAVIVGSGYGAGPVAHHLARAGWRVCVLERGAERTPGEFPATMPQVFRSVRAQAGRWHLGPKDALLDFRIERDVSVVLGCGLGGGSLVNASVCLEAPPELWDDPRWPAALAADRDGIARAYAAAHEMLQPVPHPHPPAKFHALERSAAALGSVAERAPINVTFTPGDRRFGVQQTKCTGCGNCSTGCNVGAKNTIDRTYLASARRAGAQLFCGLGVRTVLAGPDGGWVVRAEPSERRPADPGEVVIHARVVVLAAGTLGSTEILMRSRAAGLPTSDRLGTRFSGNGDVLGFSFDGAKPVHSVGWPARSRPGWADRGDQPGPLITGMVKIPETAGLAPWVLLQEGTIPGAMAPIVAITWLLGSWRGIPPEGSRWRRWWRRVRELGTPFKGAWGGPADRSQIFLVMGNDESDGRLRLRRDVLRVDWAGEGDAPEFATVDALLRTAAHGDRATSIENPVSELPLQRRMITSHPLGGCPMADDAARGVVDHAGRVFDPSADAATTQTHNGLYVSDGSVMPRSLGLNPSFTIAALAERTAHHILADHPDIGPAGRSAP